MRDKIKKLLLTASIVWLTFFALPGPRQVYDYVFGSGIRNPQYLFADSDREACRRVRRVIENGKVNIYVENLPSHEMHISLSQQQIRTLIVMCNHKR